MVTHGNPGPTNRSCASIDSDSQTAEVPGNGWAQIVAFAGYYELFVYKFNGTPGGAGSGGTGGGEATRADEGAMVIDDAEGVGI